MNKKKAIKRLRAELKATHAEVEALRAEVRALRAQYEGAQIIQVTYKPEAPLTAPAQADLSPQIMYGQ